MEWHTDPPGFRLPESVIDAENGTTGTTKRKVTTKAEMALSDSKVRLFQRMRKEPRRQIFVVVRSHIRIGAGAVLRRVPGLTAAVSRT